MWSDEIYEDSIKPIRICKECGKEAWIYEDLKMFIKSISIKYLYKNRCKDCESYNKWKKVNPNKSKEEYKAVLKKKI